MPQTRGHGAAGGREEIRDEDSDGGDDQFSANLGTVLAAIRVLPIMRV
jgi:hypothetical protein